MPTPRRAAAFVRSLIVLLVLVVALAGCGSSSAPSGESTSDPSGTGVPAPSGGSPTPVPTRRLTVLGDSIGSPLKCPGCTTYAERVATALGSSLGEEVEVVDLTRGVAISVILDLVRDEASTRDAVKDADAVLVLVSQNDLSFNLSDDPCGVAPDFPRIRWAALTRTCIDRTVRTYARHLEALLDEVDELRDGQPTMLRVVTAFNTVIGDKVDPTWNSPAAIDPSVYNVARMAAVQCRIAERHGGECVDALHTFNGRDGRDSAQPFLNSYDATHLAQKGHDVLAEAVIELGFAPLHAG